MSEPGWERSHLNCTHDQGVCRASGSAQIVEVSGREQVRNEVVWFTGADDGSEGFVVTLVQSDGSEHGLFRIEPDGDAMAIGMMVAALDMAGCAGARWMHRASATARESV